MRRLQAIKSCLVPQVSSHRGFCSAHATLGIHPDASLDQIHKAYKALALQHHPDTGGSAAQFVAIQRAFEEARQSVLDADSVAGSSHVRATRGMSKSVLLERLEHVLFELELLEEELRESRREARELGEAWRDACTVTPGEDDWEERSTARQEVFGPMMTLEQRVQEDEALKVQLEAELSWLQKSLQSHTHDTP